jgi:hypothetical protein
MQLRVVSQYVNRNVGYQPGQIIDVSPEEAVWLMTDAPSCFEEVVEVPAESKSDSSDQGDGQSGEGEQPNPDTQPDGSEDDESDEDESAGKDVDGPPADKMVKEPPKRK